MGHYLSRDMENNADKRTMLFATLIEVSVVRQVWSTGSMQARQAATVGGARVVATWKVAPSNRGVNDQQPGSFHVPRNVGRTFVSTIPFMANTVEEKGPLVRWECNRISLFDGSPCSQNDTKKP